MNNSQPEAMIAVREERIRIGATEVEQKTVVATTPDGGVVTYKIAKAGPVEDLRVPPSMQPRAPAPVARPAIQPSPAVVVVDESPPSSSEFSCVDCCFKCDTDYNWYNPRGKGFCFVLLLLLGYLIVGVVSGGILLALLILYVVGGCLKAIFDDD